MTSEVNEMSTASRGSQPVAWAVLGDGYEYVSMTPEMCGAWATENGGRTVPLYAQPQALTVYERDVLQRTLEHKERLAGDAIEPRGWMAIQADTDADVLRGLLARLA